MENLSQKFLNSIDGSIEHYDGICDELTFSVLEKFGNESDCYIEIKPQDPAERLEYIPDPTARALGAEEVIDRWVWHVAPVINGLVHDAWFPDLVLTPYAYLIRAFPNQKTSGRFVGGWRNGDGIST